MTVVPTNNATELTFDGDGVAVRAATRGDAKAQIAGLEGIEFTQVRAKQVWMKPCDCEDCQEFGAETAHGYDEFWIGCAKTDEGAVHWWEHRW